MHPRVLQQMDIEALWYEVVPYVYGIGGLVAFFVKPESTLLRLSGALLVVAAATIFRLRWVYRRAHFIALPTPDDPRIDAGT